MTTDLVDTTALSRHRDRIINAPARFLHDLAGVEIKERLAEVNRPFTSVAVVTGFSDIWAELMPQAQIYRDSAVLDLGTSRFDLVIHVLALHWANDPVGQMIQCRRALKPDGLFLAVQFGGQTLNELRTVLAEAEIAVSGGLSPRVLPMAELTDLGGLLMRAGFALPVADSVVSTVTYANLPHLMRDLRQMGENNALTGRRPRMTARKLMTLAGDLYRRHFSDGDGRLVASFELIYLAGWAPDASQQKPLKPGSAQMRLADALGTVEFDADGRDG